jgi:SAM-dependent methyltransferase
MTPPIGLATEPARPVDPALAAYEPLAPYYDLFTQDSAYEPVIDAVESWAVAQGLAGRRLLDVGCGTGNSFLPLLERGYAVTACDISPAMVAEARRKAAGRAAVEVADMRSLGRHSEFDLVTCLDDAVNYLLTDADLDAAMRSMARALTREGILVFDTTALGGYRADFTEQFDVEADGAVFHWSGAASRDLRPGDLVEMTLTVESADGEVRETRHHQRHWPVDRLRAACERAGFEQVVFRGLAPGPQLVGEPDEELHLKVVCLAARPNGTATPPAQKRGKGLS